MIFFSMTTRSIGGARFKVEPVLVVLPYSRQAILKIRERSWRIRVSRDGLPENRWKTAANRAGEMVDFLGFHSGCLNEFVPRFSRGRRAFLGSWKISFRRRPASRFMARSLSRNLFVGKIDRKAVGSGDGGASSLAWGVGEPGGDVRCIGWSVCASQVSGHNHHRAVRRAE